MPRRDACWPPRCWAGMTSVSGLCPLCRGQRGQAGSRGRGIAGKHVHQPKLRRGDRRLDDPRYRTSRSGYQYLPTHAPLALLAGVFHELRASRMRGEPFIPPVAVPEQRFVWERVVAEPGAGTFRATCRCWEKGPSRSGWRRRRFHIACPGCRRRARRIHLPRPGGAGTGRLRPGGAMDGLAAAIQPRHAGRALPSDVVRGGECDQRARPGAAAGGAGRVPQGAGRTRVLGLGAGRVGEDDRAARPGGGSDRALGRRWPAGSRAVRRADRGASGGRFRLGRAAGADAGRRVIHQRARRLPRAADAGGAVAQAGRCRRQADGPGRQAHRACRAPVQRLWHADSLARHAGGAARARRCWR